MDLLDSQGLAALAPPEIQREGGRVDNAAGNVKNGGTQNDFSPDC